MSEEKPYKLGIALSGGGARGFAHAGALKAIEEAGLKPDIIAGVSAGSVVSVLYAAGVKPDDILKIFSDLKVRDLCEFSAHTGGLFKINRFKKLILKNIGGYTNLEDLNIPTYIGVTDFDHGCPAEFHSGEIGDRMIASCSIPIVFYPVKIDGVKYVDGGVLRNMPSWIIRDKCERLIGINCSPLTPEGPAKGSMSVFNIALRTYNLMAKANQAEDMALCDLAVTTPDISHYKVFNLKEINKVFISGYAATKRALKDVEWIKDLKK